MTHKELNGYYYTDKLIRFYERRIAQLESELDAGGMNFDGMPHNHVPQNRVEKNMLEVITLRDKINAERKKLITERDRLESYIATVAEPQIRLIMYYRFFEFLTWRQVAFRLGGGNTKDSVRKALNRFLAKN